VEGRNAADADVNEKVAIRLLHAKSGRSCFWVRQAAHDHKLPVKSRPTKSDLVRAPAVPRKLPVKAIEVARRFFTGRQNQESGDEVEVVKGGMSRAVSARRLQLEPET